MKKYINLWCESCQIMRDFFAMPNIKSAFLWGFALYATALFALIRADIYYMDDLSSSIVDLSWNHNSRYIGTFLLNDLSTFGKGALDMSPLLQIIAVFFVVASSMILIYLIRGKFDLLGVVASLPLGLSPHFLQNLSYKFESLFMGVALFLAVAPFLFQKHKRIFCAVSIISLLCMLMCYQAANATYIILSLYFAFSAYFLQNRSFKQSAGFLGICAVNLIIASALYKITINPIAPLGISDKMIAFDSHFFAGVWANLAQYLIMIFNDLKSTAYIWLILLNFALFAINIASNRPKIYAIFGAIMFLLLGLLASYGLYLVLEMPLFHPRAFYGFNALVAVIGIANVSMIANFSVNLNQKSQDSQDLRKVCRILHCFSIIIAVITAYFLISFANIYGNALKKQDEYLDFRARLLLSDLSDKIPRGASITIDISHIANAPVTKRFYDKYGNLLLIPRLAKQDDFWFNMKLRHLNAPYNLNNDEICNFIKENFGVELVAKNAYHTIELAKSCYIVTIK